MLETGRHTPYEIISKINFYLSKLKKIFKTFKRKISSREIRCGDYTK